MATKSALGGSVRRREDPALIQGKGFFTDDYTPHGTAYVAFARSPYAAATINSINTDARQGCRGC